MSTTEVAQVEVQSAWLSKINWGELVKVGAALLATKGINLPPDVQNDILLAIVSLGGIYTFVVKTWFTKTITPASAAGPDVPTTTIVKILLVAFLMSAFLAPRAQAADNLPIFPIKAPAAAPCVAQNCSGWYAGFGILGDGSNADIIGNGINGSVFSSGGAIKLQGGYQLWNGSWFAAIDGSVGYEFTTNASASAPIVEKGGSKFIATELVKLGYNFLPQAGSAITTPSQSPIPLTVPASLLASSTPYMTFGGMQRRGISEWVNGVGVQTVIAAGWSSDVKYLYAPSQQGVPATSVVMFELNKHF